MFGRPRGDRTMLSRSTGETRGFHLGTFFLAVRASDEAET